MPWIEWRPEYNVHINKIDEQHKKFVGIINKLYEALSDEAVVKDVIRKVIEIYWIIPSITLARKKI